MPEPLVTVLMSVFNGEDFLGQAIDGILGQSFGEFQFLIVDDGSRDTTPAILADYAKRDPRITLILNEKNAGLTVSLNRGLARATGRFLARQDADDVALPNRLAKQVAFFRSHPGVGLLGGHCLYVDGDGKGLGDGKAPCTDTEIRWQSLFINPFFHTTVMFRREIVGGDLVRYDESLANSQDYELWVRMLAQTRAFNLGDPLALVRRHGRQVTVRSRERQRHIALEIARRQVTALLGRAVSLEDMADLRLRFEFIPPTFEREDPDLYALLLQLFHCFRQNPGLDLILVRRLGRQLSGHVLTAIPASHWPALWRHDVFRQIRGFHPFAIPRNLLGRVWRRLF